ncbi:MAG: Lrp/AsnC ligand binding domain-containing protein, partial [Thermoanaerobaculia bacterium]
LLAYVAVRTDERVGDECAGERLARIPEVQEVHHVAGEDCYLLKVRVRDAKALGRLLQERIKAVEPVRSTRTTVVLDTLRETSLLPLHAAATAVEAEEPIHA